MHSSAPAPASASVAVILNVNAGTLPGSCTPDGIGALFREAGIEASIHPVRTGAEIREETRAALARGVPVIVAAGGDGTVSAVAALVRGTPAALAVLPVGTLNHFARDLGIPTDIPQAVAAIAKGTRVGIDVGEVNERLFINNASLGIYPDIVRDRTRQQRRLGRGKYWAMLWATLAVMRRSPFMRLRLEIDGNGVVEGRSPFVFIGNNTYTMEGFNIGTRSSLRAGRLSVYTTRRRSRWNLLGLAIRALFGRLHQARDFSTTHASTLRIESRHRRLWVATDGELNVMMTPLNFRILPAALPVIVPA